MSIILRNTESGISDSSIFLISYSAQDAILSVYLALIVLCFLRNMSAERLKRLNLAQDAILSKNNLIRWIMGLWLCWDGGSEGHVCPSDGEGRDGGSHLLNERFRKAVRRTEPPTAGWIVHRTKFNE